MSVSVSVLTKPSLALPYCTLSSLDDNQDDVPSSIETFQVAATVVVKLSRPTKVTALKASFVTQQFLQDHEEQRTGSNECFLQTITLLSDKKGLSTPYLLHAGVHQYEATFIVPSWLPATTNCITDKVCHRIVAHLEIPNNTINPFAAKRLTKTGVAEVHIVREPPMTLNALRYWSGQRRSAATSIALKTTRFARVGGKLKISMRVKSLEPLQSCKIDLVQNETYTTDIQEDSMWCSLPGASSSSVAQPPILPFLNSHDLDGATFKKRNFPLPTISTGFPEPENPEDSEELTATLSTLTLQFPLAGALLRPRFESPLVSISHKIRIRIQFKSPDVKEVVVNIPVSLFEGSASCDDIPPYYEDIYIENQRARSDSVATLPLYTAKEDSVYVADASAAEDSQSVLDQERLLESQERNMGSRSISLAA